MAQFPTGSINIQSDAPNYGFGGVKPDLLKTSHSFSAFENALLVTRSNATVAMTDSLPVGTSLVNGWKVTIFNQDSAASITLTPTLPSTINATTSLTIAAGKSTTVYCDGTNYIATLPI